MAFTLLPNLDNLTFDTSIELPPITKELVERLEARYGKDRGAIQMYLRRYSIERDTQLLMKGQKKLKEEANELKKEAMKEAVELNSGSVDMAAISRNLTYLKEKLEKNGILTPSQKQNKEAAASVTTKASYENQEASNNYKTFTQKMNTARTSQRYEPYDAEYPYYMQDIMSESDRNPALIPPTPQTLYDITTMGLDPNDSDKSGARTSKSKIKVIEEEVSVKTEIKVKRRRFNFDE